MLYNYFEKWWFQKLESLIEIKYLVFVLLLSLFFNLFDVCNWSIFIFLLFNSQVFCWMDRWHGLTMEDIRAIEDKVKEELDKQRHEGEVRGTRADSD